MPFDYIENPTLGVLPIETIPTVTSNTEVDPIVVNPPAHHADTMSIESVYQIIDARHEENVEMMPSPDVSNVEWATFFMDGFELHDATPEDVVNFHEAVVYLQQSALGRSVLEQAAINGVDVNIIHNGNDSANYGLVFWDPNSGLQVDGGRIQSAAIGLVHELYHTIQMETTMPQFLKASYPDYDNNAEYWAITNVETVVATTLGEPTRTNHSGVPVRKDSSTAHT